MAATAELWARYGHRRLYVTVEEDGTKLGFYDLKTGRACNVPSARLNEFLEAITAWKTAHPDELDPVAEPPAHAPGEAPDSASPRPWKDLAQNRPGQSAAEVADAYRHAQPLRSLASRVLGTKSDERGWRVGAAGEVKTARQLAKLTNPGLFDRIAPGRWYALHSIPIGERGRDIDHLAIGPPGVFVINSKNHQELVTATDAAVFLGGRRTRYAEVAQDEAIRASRLLTAACSVQLPVTPMLSIVNAPTVVRGCPRGVIVLRVDQVAEWLASRPVRYQASTVDKLFEVCRRSTTWEQ
ncbi:NERD domain-containing protein [Actinoplanes sp. LDG1-06]|uniref:NERD domain-containing protein n=1 Tax=Paractinoplanes ovalisporus TaxID=2810368 RepID=A0ABS2AJK3_9ACTN|nr:nuclease-related domain-containing protein [Actinoplanes ovalisporus]MBM2620023.1 NERD domain-containing protein [Actinoplanes ovalisporus]